MTARRQSGTCKNNHAASVIRVVVDKNGRAMSICSACRVASSAKALEARRLNSLPPEPLIDRLLRIRSIDANGCWIPRLAGKAAGYKTIGTYRDGNNYAHRVSYEHFRGEIPAGLQIDHVCRNRGCFNPDHLEAVTARENTRRAKNTKTACVNGHAYTEETVRVRANGHRSCLICEKQQARQRYRGARYEKEIGR